KNLPDLGKQVVAVGAFEDMDVRAIPPVGAIVLTLAALGQGFDHGTERWIEEQRERQTISPAVVPYPMWRRAVPPARQPVEHVADIANERPRKRGGLDP